MSAQAVYEQVHRLTHAGADREAVLRGVVRILHDHFPKYTWTGIYLLEGDELVLHNFIGKPSPHTRIPIGKGICGAAAAQRETILVPDVRVDARYLACSLETQSEIVVPILHAGQVYGEIDIDSDTPDAFDAKDKEILETVAAQLGAWLSDHGEHPKSHQDR